MKTWEMIKELTENPNKRFKIKNGKATVGISDSRLQWLDDEDVEVEFVLTELILHDMEWEEVKGPVDFMDVLKQAKKDNAKLFTIKNPVYDINFTKKPLYFILSYLTATCTDDLLADILLDSEWYIEDDEND